MADTFLKPQEELGALAKIGRGLGAFGAGVGGRGSEFLAGIKAEERELSFERKKAAADDLQEAKRLLDLGDIKSIRDLAIERAQLISELGGDNSGTVGLLNLATATLGGDQKSFKLLRSEIEGGLQEAAQAGIIKLPAAPKPLSPEAKLEADVRAGLIERPKPVTDLVTTLSPEEVAEEGFIEGTIVQRTPKGELKVISKPEVIKGVTIKPQTDIGKLNADLAAGKITPQQFNASMQKKTALSGETAFKAAGIVQASEALPQLKELLFKDGDLQESLLLTARIPGATDAKKVRALARTTVGAMLRGESGAVISESEIEEALDNFLPNTFDSDESALFKIEQLETRIFTARDLLLPEIGQNPPTITTQEQFDNLPSGAEFIEDGVRRRKQ